MTKATESQMTVLTLAAVKHPVEQSGQLMYTSKMGVIVQPEERPATRNLFPQG